MSGALGKAVVSRRRASASADWALTPSTVHHFPLRELYDAISNIADALDGLANLAIDAALRRPAMKNGLDVDQAPSEKPRSVADA